MALLTNLKVKKVSFVDKAANKRKFLLLKSVDGKEKEIEQPTTTKIEKEEESIMLKEEIQKSVRLLLKAGMTDEKIVETLKSEHKMSDAEAKELGASLTLVRSLVPPVEPPATPAATPAVKADGNGNDDVRKEFDAIRKENAELRDTIKKDADDRKKNEIKLWLSAECSHLPADAAEIVEDIFRMSQTNPEGAERLKKSLKTSSDAVRNSSLLIEKGSSYDSSPVPSGSIILKKVKDSMEEVHKSGGTLRKSSDVIIDAVRSLGPQVYKQYRDEHNLRAKLGI